MHIPAAILRLQYRDMVTSVHAAARPDDPVTFRQYWLAETVRLRESQWGPLQDGHELRRARTLGRDFTQRLLLRARFLGQREGMDTTIEQWMRGSRLAFVVLLVLAVVIGATTAAGALGDGSRQVNLVLALAALLGVHGLTFVFWCAGSLYSADHARTGLGDLWLWLTQKLARSPQAALVPRALVGLLARHRALRPLLGAVSHALWSVIIIAMLCTLLVLLSARRYTYSWETTLLSPDIFVNVTRALGWLPAKLGFNIPPDAIIRASDGIQTLPDVAHAQWSAWLIGCLVCYGLAPRLIALALTIASVRRRVRNIRLDPDTPGYVELRDRLDPVSTAGEIDAPAPHALPEITHPDVSHSTLPTGHAVVGLELAPDQAWPFWDAPSNPKITDLGIVDDRAQRQRLFELLDTRPPEKLLIVCDAHQTPDRGTIHMISDLSATAQHARILLLMRPTEHCALPERVSIWKEHLERVGFAEQDSGVDAGHAITWLATSTADHPLADGAS